MNPLHKKYANTIFIHEPFKIHLRPLKFQGIIKTPGVKCVFPLNGQRDGQNWRMDEPGKDPKITHQISFAKPETNFVLSLQFDYFE